MWTRSGRRLLRTALLPLSLALLAGCYGYCPSFPLRDDLSKEQLEWIREKQKAAGRQLTEPAWVATQRTTRFRGPLTFGSRDLRVWGQPLHWNAGPINYAEGEAGILPLPIPIFLHLEISAAWYDFEGRNLGFAHHRSFIFQLFGWGRFHYEHSPPTPILTSYPSPGFVAWGPGAIPSLFLPSSRYFSGRDGRYWHAGLGFIGHISTEESLTLVVFGSTPIQYWRSPRRGDR